MHSQVCGRIVSDVIALGFVLPKGVEHVCLWPGKLAVWHDNIPLLDVRIDVREHPVACSNCWQKHSQARLSAL